MSLSPRRRTKVLAILCVPPMLWSKQTPKSAEDFANILWSSSGLMAPIKRELLRLVSLRDISDIAGSKEELSKIIAISMRGMRDHWMDCGFPVRKVAGRPMLFQYAGQGSVNGRKDAIEVAKEIADTIFPKAMSVADYKKRISDLEAEVRRLKDEVEE